MSNTRTAAKNVEPDRDNIGAPMAVTNLRASYRFACTPLMGYKAKWAPEHISCGFVTLIFCQWAADGNKAKVYGDRNLIPIPQGQAKNPDTEQYSAPDLLVHLEGYGPVLLVEVKHSYEDENYEDDELTDEADREGIREKVVRDLEGTHMPQLLSQANKFFEENPERRVISTLLITGRFFSLLVFTNKDKDRDDEDWKKSLDDAWVWRSVTRTFVEGIIKDGIDLTLKELDEDGRWKALPENVRKARKTKFEIHKSYIQYTDLVFAAQDIWGKPKRGKKPQISPDFQQALNIAVKVVMKDMEAKPQELGPSLFKPTEAIGAAAGQRQFHYEINKIVQYWVNDAMVAGKRKLLQSGPMPLPGTRPKVAAPDFYPGPTEKNLRSDTRKKQEQATRDAARATGAGREGQPRAGPSGT